MLKRKQIEPGILDTKTNSEKTVFDPIKQAGELLKKSQGDITKRAAALSQIARLLSEEKDKAVQGVYLDEICKTNDIKKTSIRAAIHIIETDKKKKLKLKYQEDQELLTKLDKYEMFLSKNFNIRYNEILMEFEITDKNNPDKKDIDEFAILRAMRKANIEITEKSLIEILKSPYVDRYNPIRDYFNSLKDYNPKEPDYINELAGYLHIEDFDHFLNHFKKHLVRVIAGALEVAFNKQVFVLVGDGQYNQNSGKSTFIRFLTPPALSEYYLEDLPQDKDGLIALTDNFIVNFDELESLTRYEINKLKSILSKDTIKVRPPYGRRAISIPRRASFFGSTNEISFLTDLTGNVRWIVFKFKDVERPINWNYKKDIDINNIWRQAYYLFKSGFNYNLTREEIQENETRNFDFLTLPPEYDMINQMYMIGTKQEHDVFYTTTDFLNALNEQSHGSIRLNIIRLGKTLRKLGFKQVSDRPRDEKNPVKGYWVKFNPYFQAKNYHPIKESEEFTSENNKTSVKKNEESYSLKLRQNDDDQVPF